MANSKARAVYEYRLAAAHSNLHRAAQAAADMGSEGEQLDCEQLLREITRLGQDSLRGKARRNASIPHQLEMWP